MVTAPGGKGGVVGPERRRILLLALPWEKCVASLDVSEEFLHLSPPLDDIRQLTVYCISFKVPVHPLVFFIVVSVDGRQVKRSNTGHECDRRHGFTWCYIVVFLVVDRKLWYPLEGLQWVEFIIVEEIVGCLRVDCLCLYLLAVNVLVGPYDLGFDAKRVSINNVSMFVLQSFRLVIDEPL